MHGLTKKQIQILDFIASFSEENKVAPSYREIMAHFKFSSLGSVYRHIHALKNKGALNLKERSARSMQLQQQIHSPRMESLVSIPFIGMLQAGFPLETFAKTESINLPSSWVPNPEDTYILKAKNDSMNEEQIARGDLLIIEAKNVAVEGEIVLALINSHDMLLKRYFPDESFVRLEANNPMYRPIIVRKDAVQIQGILIGVFRCHLAGLDQRMSEHYR